MDFLFDTADLNLISQYQGMFGFTGVTTNPALLRKAGVTEHTFSHLREIRSVIGHQRTLHIQVVSHGWEDMVREANTILERVDDRVYIKIPVTPDGMRAMKCLKQRGVRVTATTVLTQMQAILALAAGADYIAPYYSQMCDNGVDGCKLIGTLVDMIQRSGKPTTILAANIKDVTQLRQVAQAGTPAITLNPQLLEESLLVPQIEKAIQFFDDAWKDMHGTTGLCDLAD